MGEQAPGNVSFATDNQATVLSNPRHGMFIMIVKFCMFLFNFVQVSVMYCCYVCSVLCIMFHFVVLCIVRA